MHSGDMGAASKKEEMTGSAPVGAVFSAAQSGARDGMPGLAVQLNAKWQAG